MTHTEVKLEAGRPNFCFELNLLLKESICAVWQHKWPVQCCSDDEFSQFSALALTGQISTSPEQLHQLALSWAFAQSLQILGCSCFLPLEDELLCAEMAVAVIAADLSSVEAPKSLRRSSDKRSNEMYWAHGLIWCADNFERTTTYFKWWCPTVIKYWM